MSKNKKKVNKIGKFPCVLFVLSLVGYLTSSLFLRTYNNQLSMDIQAYNRKIDAYIVENDSLKASILAKTNKDVVISSANSAGLTYNDKNIITIMPKN